MSIKAIRGKLLALTREYHLREEPNDVAVTEEFSLNRATPFSGIGITWWITRRGISIRDDIARLMATEIPSLRMDIEVLSSTIGEILQDNAGNRSLFRALFLREHATLFAARVVDEKEFSIRLWTLLHDTLANSICSWLVVVPLRRLLSEPVELGADGLFIVPRNSDLFWRSISQEFPAAREWSPTTGVSGDRDIHIHGSKLPESWLACKVTGDQSRALIDARHRMQTFVAVLYAQLHTQTPGLLLKSMADVPDLCHQFCSYDANREFGRISSSIGEILPPLLDDVTLTGETLARMRDWYEARDAANQPNFRRASIASQFVQHALIADELERFIYFFISLDALFGVRGNVEESIVGRVEQLHAGDWGARARRLFDLRNEVVHGGCSRIEDWHEYDAYVRHFKSKPTEDTAALALKSTIRYWESTELPLPSRKPRRGGFISKVLRCLR